MFELRGIMVKFENVEIYKIYKIKFFESFKISYLSNKN